jgi:hypothetical protein
VITANDLKWTHAGRSAYAITGVYTIHDAILTDPNATKRYSVTMQHDGDEVFLGSFAELADAIEEIRMDGEYNGWSNYQTWNVSLWLSNTENSYRDMIEFIMTYEPKTPDEYAYDEMIKTLKLANRRTGDGVAYNDPRIDREMLDEMLFELKRDLS